MILDHPNCFGQVQIILVKSESFLFGPNCFDQVQIRLLWTNFCNLDPSKMWYWTKMIWTVQNNFGPMEGQGIRIRICSLVHIIRNVLLTGYNNEFQKYESGIFMNSLTVIFDGSVETTHWTHWNTLNTPGTHPEHTPDFFKKNKAITTHPEHTRNTPGTHPIFKK